MLDYFYYSTGKEFVISTITIEEYAIVPYREKNKKLLDDFDMLLEDTRTEIIDITKTIAKKASEIRAYYSKSKAMDALQFAAVVISGCNVFLTNDKQLRQFTEIKVMTMNDLLGICALKMSDKICNMNLEIRVLKQHDLLN